MADVFRRGFYRLAPSWLTSGEGELVLFSLGLISDAFADRARDAALTRFPQYAPADALAPMGRDRRIVRGIGESQASYALRLLRWLDDWRTAGNPFSLMRQIGAYLNTPTRIRTVDHRGNWYTTEADGTTSALLDQGNWDWDSITNPDFLLHWSRFWVIIYPPPNLWVAGPNWGDPLLWGGAWGTPGYTWGSTATPEQVSTVRSIVHDWKPAGTRCVNIIIAFDPASFDPTFLPGPPLPDGTWGHWSQNVGGVQVPTRLDTARYWDG